MVKPRENRVPIMMSDAELDAIDDWRFENRVATRSDAIRRLCRIGNQIETVIPEITEHATLNLQSARLFFDFALRTARGKDDDPTLTELVGRAKDYLDRAEDFWLMIVRENNRIVPLADHKNLKRAFTEADRANAEMNRIITAHISEDSDDHDSQLMAAIFAELTDKDISDLKKLSPSKRHAFWARHLSEKRKAMPQYQET